MQRIYLGNILGPRGIQGPPGNSGPRGYQGLKGNDGKNGVGVPLGGSQGQVLIKTGNPNYQTDWEYPYQLVIDDGIPRSDKVYSSSKVDSSINQLNVNLLNAINNSGYEILYEVTSSGIYGISGKQFCIRFTNGFRSTDNIIFLPMYNTVENQNNLLAIGGCTALSNGYNPSQPNEWKFVAGEDLTPEMNGKFLSITALIFRKKGA